MQNWIGIVAALLSAVATMLAALSSHASAKAAKSNLEHQRAMDDAQRSLLLNNRILSYFESFMVTYAETIATARERRTEARGRKLSSLVQEFMHTRDIILVLSPEAKHELDEWWTDKLTLPGGYEIPLYAIFISDLGSRNVSLDKTYFEFLEEKAVDLHSQYKSMVAEHWPAPITK